jgi:VWFA-related protein
MSSAGSLINLRALVSISLCLCLFTANIARAQQQPARPTPSPTPPITNQTLPPAQDEDIVRINTQLVQTDVMVFDREGRFVDNLTRDQFELRVDGQAREISFFEQVRAGSINEEAQLAAARGLVRERATTTNPGIRPLDRGRTIFFLVDDLHLSAESAIRARSTIERFIEREIGQNDEAAIASTSGAIGFLQQLTDNKTVLRRAAARINARTRTITDFERPRMSEYQALAVERYDRDLLNYFVEETMRQTPGITRTTAEQAVQTRARSIVQQSVSITTATLSALEGLVRSSASLPGRKLVFFISDGFFLNRTESNVSDRMRRITDAAARSGTVIYTLDARGLVSGLPDASEEGQFDPSGVVSRSAMGEISDSQEVLQTLAADTGGRALINRNDIEAGIIRSLRETSVYYLLAWRPESDAPPRGNRFHRIEVSVRNRPDLTVRVRRGYLTQPSDESLRTSRRAESRARRDRQNAPPSTDRRLLDALVAPYPRTALPLSLSAGYLNLPPNNIALVISMGFDAESLFGQNATADPTRRAEVDVAGAAYNERGAVVSSFRQQLTITAQAQAIAQPLIYSNQFRLTAPGLYQIRVAARNRQTDVAGSAVQWIEIPESGNRLSLSSLFVGERPTQSISATPNAESTSGGQSPIPSSVSLSATRRFARSSILRFLTYIYNASRSGNAGAPDVALQVQVFRDDQPVVTAPLRRISTEGLTDFTRIPYAAEIQLQNLPVGRYQLRVTAIDRTARTSATQQIDFTIE